MNKRERVIAAMNGKEVDHVPAGFWFHFNGGEAAGDACVQAHLNYYRETDLDFVKIMCDGYFPFPLPEISSPADWKKVKPLPEEHPFIRGQVERAKAIVKEIGQEVLQQANKFTDTNILHMCGWGGNRNQLELWRDYPAKVVNWAVFVEGLSLEEGRSYFGGRTVLGGFETHWDGTVQEGVIYKGTKEKLQTYTKLLIQNYGKTGLMLGGDCTVDARIDRQRIRWIVEAARSL